MDSANGSVLETWRAAGSADDDATAWITAATPRFTPHTARAWQREGFGPADAALWSEVHADPAAARAQRSSGFDNPFTPEPIEARVRRLRERQGFSVEELAQAAGVPVEDVLELEHAENASADEVQAAVRLAHDLSRALGVSLEYLVLGATA